jgi:hypothetical protein
MLIGIDGFGVGIEEGVIVGILDCAIGGVDETIVAGLLNNSIGVVDDSGYSKKSKKLLDCGFLLIGVGLLYGFISKSNILLSYGFLGVGVDLVVGVAVGVAGLFK